MGFDQQRDGRPVWHRTNHHDHGGNDINIDDCDRDHNVNDPCNHNHGDLANNFDRARQQHNYDRRGVHDDHYDALDAACNNFQLDYTRHKRTPDIFTAEHLNESARDVYDAAAAAVLDVAADKPDDPRAVDFKHIGANAAESATALRIAANKLGQLSAALWKAPSDGG